VALPKIFGVETEFGIIHRGVEDPNPITASSMLINAYLAEVERRAGQPHTAKVDWDFEDESPANDARGISPYAALPPDVETNLVNAVLTNGARYYVDHAHPELSGPECADPRSVVVWDKAAEEILRRSMVAVGSMLPPGQELVVYKNNSDRKGNSYGTHENYLMDRATPFSRIVARITPHFITRQLYIGAGKVGSEAGGLGPDKVPFQLTQRADFFEEEVGLETTLKRPIVNTRDEPHADPQKYRRLHVIVGDANLSETATFLKVGTTGLLLAMIEDDWLGPPVRFDAPVWALRQVSYDLSLRQPLRLADGSTTTAMAVQWTLLDRASAYVAEHGDQVLGGGAADVLRVWEEVLTDLEADPMRLADRLDWVAKLRVIDGYRERHGLEWGDARLAAMDLQYHDLRPSKSLFARLDVRRLTTDAEVLHAVDNPPPDTRAYFRGRCLQRWPDKIVTANWDSMVFDVGAASLRRVPMMEPIRGTKAHVGRLLDECATAAELLDRLGA